jgi:hypothetical protein
MTLNIGIRLRFDAGLRKNTNIATNRCDAAARRRVVWPPLPYGRGREYSILGLRDAMLTEATNGRFAPKAAGPKSRFSSQTRLV